MNSIFWHFNFSFFQHYFSIHLMWPINNGWFGITETEKKDIFTDDSVWKRDSFLSVKNMNCFFGRMLHVSQHLKFICSFYAINQHWSMMLLYFNFHFMQFNFSSKSISFSKNSIFFPTGAMIHIFIRNENCFTVILLKIG